MQSSIKTELDGPRIIEILRKEQSRVKRKLLYVELIVAAVAASVVALWALILGFR